VIIAAVATRGAVGFANTRPLQQGKHLFRPLNNCVVAGNRSSIASLAAIGVSAFLDRPRDTFENRI
jgi:hypothetical protein